ncbi:MAG: hypothetical protein C5B44_04865 [Acidobacteria bacterium]|nr:MAG: hypothetical protein C5B44_04865 [Acidobacteriota bacterium]
MNVAFGLKAHSGWAALVVLGQQNDKYVVVDRRRIELVESESQKQPYHAAENLRPEAAREVVRRGIAVAQRMARQEMREAIRRERDRKNEVAGCGVLVSDPMPDWSVEEILAVHFRMHKAEGVLFRDVLVRAANSCELRLVAIPEKQLIDHAITKLATSQRDLLTQLSTLGKSVGPPWGKDQKEATLAAMIALNEVE